MAEDKVTVIARIKARAGMEERVREELLALVGPTHEEEGCLNYDLHQSLDDPTLFMFHENWTSRAALDAHSQRPHLRAFGERTTGMLDGPVEITLWSMLD